MNKWVGIPRKLMCRTFYNYLLYLDVPIYNRQKWQNWIATAELYEKIKHPFAFGKFDKMLINPWEFVGSFTKNFEEKI